MALHNVSHDRILKAIKLFDHDLRETMAWQGWEQEATQKYAILYEGNYYPPKQIIGIALGLSNYDFNITRRYANKYLQERGFIIIALDNRTRRNLKENSEVSKYYFENEITQWATEE